MLFKCVGTRLSVYIGLGSISVLLSLWAADFLCLVVDNGLYVIMCVSLIN